MMLLRVLLLISLVGIIGRLGAQDVPPFAACEDKSTGYDLGWRLEDDHCVLRQSVSIEGQVAFPQEVAERSPFARAVMMEYISQEQRAFWDLMIHIMQPEASFPFDTLNSYEIKYEIFWHSPDIVSVIFLRLSFPGGGRGNPTFQAFTFDLRANKLLFLEDIFIEGVNPYVVLAPHAHKAMLKDWPYNEGRIIQATIPVPPNYMVWALTDSSLMIYFDGPLIAGAMAQTVVVADIPLSDLKDVLRPEFAPGT